MAAMEMAGGGATVLLLNNGTGDNGDTPLSFQTDPAVYKTAWWLGSSNDNNMGFVVYENASNNVVPGMTPGGWPDEGWASEKDNGFLSLSLSLFLLPLPVFLSRIAPPLLLTAKNTTCPLFTYANCMRTKCNYTAVFFQPSTG